MPQYLGSTHVFLLLVFPAEGAGALFINRRRCCLLVCILICQHQRRTAPVGLLQKTGALQHWFALSLQ